MKNWHCGKPMIMVEESYQDHGTFALFNMKCQVCPKTKSETVIKRERKRTYDMRKVRG